MICEKDAFGRFSFLIAMFYLAHDEPRKAWSYAKKSTELDPKSAKYLEISLEAAILLGDRQEAKRGYDKLRALSEDRPKLEAFKQRIDQLSTPL